jgi:hypothetical protein
MHDKILRLRIFHENINGSTNIEKVEWDSISRQMLVQYNGGDIYTYYRVPQGVYEGIIIGDSISNNGKSPSVGSAVHKYLINRNFRYTRGGLFKK